MNCPVCDEKLREVDKHGVTVDICPGCKGVWLDRGELDKIIEMVEGGSGNAAQTDAPVRAQQAIPQHFGDDDDYDDRRRSDKYDERPQQYRKRKSSILGEIFDMFGGD